MFRIALAVLTLLLMMPAEALAYVDPGTGAMTADDFRALVGVCDGDKCLGVNADPSHCWEGESWEARFRSVGERIYAAHVKNFVIRDGVPLRKMEPEWPGRAMQFTDLSSGELNLTRYIEMLIDVGYPQRYCNVTGKKTAPLVVEAESAYRDLDACSTNGIAWVRDNLCFPIAAGSFEDVVVIVPRGRFARYAVIAVGVVAPPIPDRGREQLAKHRKRESEGRELGRDDGALEVLRLVGVARHVPGRTEGDAFRPRQHGRVVLQDSQRIVDRLHEPAQGRHPRVHRVESLAEQVHAEDRLGARRGYRTQQHRERDRGRHPS